MNHEMIGGRGGDQPVGEKSDVRRNPVTGVTADVHAQAAANVAKLTDMLEQEAVTPKTPSAVEVAEQADAPVA